MAARPSKARRIHEALGCPICQETIGRRSETIGSAVGDGAGRRAVQCSNGHPFCEPCLQESLHNQQLKRRPTTCPTCRVAVDPNALIRCLVAEQLSHDVECSCSGADLGCEWQGTRGAAEAHAATCLYAQLREEQGARVEADIHIADLQRALNASVAAVARCEETASQQQRERRTIRIAEERREWQVVHLVSLGPVVPSFRALSGRLKFTVRRHEFLSLLAESAAPWLPHALGRPGPRLSGP